MLTTIEGIYEDGRVTLLEPIRGITRARVAITVLDSSGAERAPAGEPGAEQPRAQTFKQMSEAERLSFLASLRTRWQDRLSPSEEFARAKWEEIELEARDRKPSE